MIRLMDGAGYWEDSSPGALLGGWKQSVGDGGSKLNVTGPLCFQLTHGGVCDVTALQEISVKAVWGITVFSL